MHLAKTLVAGACRQLGSPPSVLLCLLMYYDYAYKPAGESHLDLGVERHHHQNIIARSLGFGFFDTAYHALRVPPTTPFGFHLRLAFVFSTPY